MRVESLNMSIEPIIKIYKLKIKVSRCCVPQSWCTHYPCVPGNISVLGPLLYILDINNHINVATYAIIALFVDDISM